MKSDNYITLLFNRKDMSKVIFTVIVIFIGAFSNEIFAQKVVNVWDGPAPGSEEWTQIETKVKTSYGEIIQNVVEPTLTVSLPEKSIQTGTAVIVCPGGGFRSLSWDSEGLDVAKWLNSHGIAAFILKYRILDTTPASVQMDKSPTTAPKVFTSTDQVIYANVNPSPDNKRLTEVIEFAVEDARRAFKIVSENAASWNIHPDKIGFLGFSAGGGVAIGASLNHSIVPGFIATAYGPALTDVMDPQNLPPLFMAVASDHPNVAIGCMALYNVWKKAGNSAELHLYGKGAGPFGMGNSGLPSDDWKEQFLRWLKSEGF